VTDRGLIRSTVTPRERERRTCRKLCCQSAAETCDCCSRLSSHDSHVVLETSRSRGKYLMYGLIVGSRFGWKSRLNEQNVNDVFTSGRQMESRAIGYFFCRYSDVGDGDRELRF